MRMQKVFRFGPHTLRLTVPQGSVVARMDEDEMLKVVKKVTNDVELAGAVSYLLTAVGASAPPHVKMCRLIRQMAALRGRLTDRLMRLSFSFAQSLS